MKERPILFSGPMVRAILSGKKTQTRRTCKSQPVESSPGTPQPSLATFWPCPYGRPGDRLWVRESGWQPKEPSIRELRDGADTWPKYAYDADGIDENAADDHKQWGWKRRPSIHMPRWASRIDLLVKDVRVERLQDISEADAESEGFPPCPLNNEHPCLVGDPGRPFACGFAFGWDSINAKRHPWSSNPWVWVVEFERVA